MESAYYPQGYPSRPRPSGEKRGERAVTGSGEGVALSGGMEELTRRRFYGARACRQGTAPPASSVPRPRKGCGWRGDDGRGGAKKGAASFGG